ncbi:MAG: hypothetical protein MJE77_43915 [Proteobacteria bacterium]|nr:hypothetical protein [Pseudomonadota bacterium]
MYSFSDELRRVYRDGLRIDLPANNGDDSWTLPMPARFVVDTGGTIHYADAAADYTVRPEPEETLAALRTLAG